MGQLEGLTRHEKDTKGTLGLGIIKTKPFCFTARVGTTVVVSCKGTDDPGDMMADATALPADFKVRNHDGSYSTYHVHMGFLKHYSAIKVEVNTGVKDQLAALAAKGTPATEIMVTGHSLGGGMANLAAVDLASGKGDTLAVSLYTYGSPRVFIGNTKEGGKDDSAFAAHELLTSPPNSIHRYMADGDPVTTVPLENMGYMHAGDGLELRQDGTCLHCHMDHTKPMKGLDNHYGDNYLRLLKAANTQCAHSHQEL